MYQQENTEPKRDISEDGSGIQMRTVCFKAPLSRVKDSAGRHTIYTRLMHQGRLRHYQGHLYIAFPETDQYRKKTPTNTA